MLKKSPSRSSRSKGIRIKHILQIVLLAGVCFWLIYQVKRSHDKKKEFDQKDNRITVKDQDVAVGEVLKLGRKDPHPHVKEVHTDEKHEEDEEEETGIEEDDSKHEGEEGQEEQKNEVDEPEDEGSKHEETDDDVRGNGDDEIDENDPEKADNDSDHEGDFVDDEKLKGGEEGNGRNEEKDEGEGDNENSSDEQDNDNGDVNAHEAREEQYKGDDASSAVAHETHSTTSETEEVILEHSDENSEPNIEEQNDKPSDSEESKAIHNVTRFTEEVDNTAFNRTSTYENTGDLELISNTSIITDGSILSIKSDDQPELGNNTSSGTIETDKAENFDPSQQNRTEIGFNHAQNETVDGSSTAQNETSLESSLSLLIHSNDTVLENENQNGVVGESLNITSTKDLTILNEKTTDSGDVSQPVVVTHNEVSQNEKPKDNSESVEAGDGLDSTNHTEDSSQEDPIDSSDSHVTERVDLDTLPDIRTAIDDNEETAAE